MLGSQGIHLVLKGGAGGWRSGGKDERERVGCVCGGGGERTGGREGRHRVRGGTHHIPEGRGKKQLKSPPFPHLEDNTTLPHLEDNVGLVHVDQRRMCSSPLLPPSPAEQYTLSAMCLLRNLHPPNTP